MSIELIGSSGNVANVDASGNLNVTLATAVTPAPINITEIAGTVLGAPSAYGTAPGAVEVIGVNASVTNTVAVTGTFFQATQPVSLAGTVAISAASLPLPTGASTSALQSTGNTSLASIATSLGGTIVVSLASTTITGTVAVSASALPLPTGASTSALQSTGNTSLATIATAVSGTLPISATALPLPTGASTSALQSTGNTSLATIATNTPALGQALAAASVPVVLPAAQITALTPLSTVAITAASLPLPTGAATSANQTAAQGLTGATAPTSAAEDGLIAATALPTAVTGGQLVGAMGDKFGRAVALLNAPRNLVAPAVLSSSSSSAVSFVAAIASTFTDLSSFVVTNNSATATTVTLSDGTVSYNFDLAANGGITWNLNTPMPASTVNTAWTVLNSAGVACHYTAQVIRNQ